MTYLVIHCNNDSTADIIIFWTCQYLKFEYTRSVLFRLHTSNGVYTLVLCLSNIFGGWVCNTLQNLGVSSSALCTELRPGTTVAHPITAHMIPNMNSGLQGRQTCSAIGAELIPTLTWKCAGLFCVHRLRNCDGIVSKFITPGRNWSVEYFKNTWFLYRLE